MHVLNKKKCETVEYNMCQKKKNKIEFINVRVMHAVRVTPRYNSRLKYPNKIALIQFDTPKPLLLASCKFPIIVIVIVRIPSSNI